MELAQGFSHESRPVIDPGTQEAVEAVKIQDLDGGWHVERNSLRLQAVRQSSATDAA